MSKFTLLLHKILPEKIEAKFRIFRDLHLRKYKVTSLPQEIYSSEISKKSISFCTTCKNRLFQLKRTYLTNIKNNANYPRVEFVLINYNSDDGLDDWAQKHLPKYIEEGICNYYHTYEPEEFHASIAKNLAHRLAKDEILCNLDGDNFTGKDFAWYINYMYNKYDNPILHFKKAPFWGTEGRLVLSRNNFDRLGGYDESLLPIGHEDHDLKNRAIAIGIGYKTIAIENFLHYLSNIRIEKAENCGSSDYYLMESANREKSNQNIQNGILTANINGHSSFTLYKNFDDKPILYGTKLV